MFTKKEATFNIHQQILHLQQLEYNYRSSFSRNSLSTITLWVTPGNTARADMWKQFLSFFWCIWISLNNIKHGPVPLPLSILTWSLWLPLWHITQGLQSLKVCVSILLGTSCMQHLGCQSLIIQCSGSSPDGGLLLLMDALECLLESWVVQLSSVTRTLTKECLAQLP